jgi:hypothetical protein
MLVIPAIGARTTGTGKVKVLSSNFPLEIGRLNPLCVIEIEPDIMYSLFS